MVDHLAEVSNGSVHFRNATDLANKLQSLVEDGSSRLQVISDYDFTMSKFCKGDGIRLPSSHSLIDNALIVSEADRKEWDQIREKYYSIEINPKMTLEEKLPHMVDWWTIAHRRLIDAKFERRQLIEIAKDTNNVILRDNIERFIDALNEADVPLLIFSAGCSDVIEEILIRRYLTRTKQKVISNKMKFDERGILIGFYDPLIHTFNKNESVLNGLIRPTLKINSPSAHNRNISAVSVQDDLFWNDLKHRKNILLIGDTIGDASMANGFENIKTIVKIGFLNGKDNEGHRLAQYLDAFDIVLHNDPSFYVPLEIVNSLVRTEKS